MADGSSYTGPSWPKLIDAMNNPTWALAKSKNLSDLEDRDEAWMNVRPTGPTPLAAAPVGEGDAATKGYVDNKKIDIAHGGTGATTEAGAREALKLSSAATTEIGTSGAKLPLLNAANTWGATQTIKSPIVVAVDGPASPASGQLINSPALRMRVNGRGANGDAMGEVGDIFIQEKVGTYVALTFNVSAFSDNKFWSMNASTGETFSPLGALAVQGSDVRIKYNFTPPKLGAWKRVEAIGICEYMYNGSAIPQRGFLAQQMGEVDEMYVFESSVSTAKDADGNEFNILNVNDRAVMADMIIVIQALQQKVTALEALVGNKVASE